MQLSVHEGMLRSRQQAWPVFFSILSFWSRQTTPHGEHLMLVATLSCNSSMMMMFFARKHGTNGCQAGSRVCRTPVTDAVFCALHLVLPLHRYICICYRNRMHALRCELRNEQKAIAAVCARLSEQRSTR